jgi:hypothetical protein
MYRIADILAMCRLVWCGSGGAATRLIIRAVGNSTFFLTSYTGQSVHYQNLPLPYRYDVYYRDSNLKLIILIVALRPKGTVI